MKTSIFDMTFVLPPMVEMTQVEKGMPTSTYTKHCGTQNYCLVCTGPLACR